MSNSETDYLSQSRSWKEGMKYRYSPDYYPITRSQFADLTLYGNSMGKYLNSKVSESILEFRLDMIKDFAGKLWVTEVQTDDRGLPAMAIARNARGNSPIFPGLVETLNSCLISQAGTPEYCLCLHLPG